MAYTCDIMGTRKLRGNRVSHANNKTPHFQVPNLHPKTFMVPELNIRVRLRVSRTALRTIDKHGGLSGYLRQADEETLIPRLKKLRKQIVSRPAAKVTIV